MSSNRRVLGVGASLALAAVVSVSVVSSAAVAPVARETVAVQPAPPLPLLEPEMDHDSVALPPTAGAKGVEQRITDMQARSRSAASTRPLPATYIKAGYTPRPLSGTDLPYNSPVLYGYDRDVPRDAAGVRMFVVGGVLYDHPVAQAQDALMSLSDYRLTGEARYLDRAVVDAQRLVDRRVLSDDAWYYPYRFDFKLHNRTDFVMRAPWFSGMAQGQALSVFSRLFEMTGEQQWRDAAAATFNSFRNAPAQNLPSTVNIDPAKYLWLEEYPRWPTTASDRTLNGHVYSAFGLYDYYRISEDPTARDVWNGAMANTRYYLVHGFRGAGFTSHYCLAHTTVRPTSYHAGHWTQLVMLHASTGDPVWSRYADLLRADYPPPAVSGTVVFAGGRHTGYKYNATGGITASKTITLSRQSNAPANARQRIQGRGVMLHITAGVLAGFWIPESYPRTWIAGSRVSLAYPLQRTVMIPVGSWSAYQYDAAGKRTAWKTIEPPRTTSAPFDASAVIDGRWHIHITAGSLADFWLPAAGTTQN